MSAPFLHEELTAGDIRAELSRILASADFASSKHLSHFLQYIVNESLAGRAHKIKERNIAVSALERDADFDPRLDPIVRVVAGKLRRTLERYYAAEGAGNPIRIGVPKGAYRPVVRQTAAIANVSVTSAATRG